jgi:hypothetical protein
MNEVEEGDERCRIKGLAGVSFAARTRKAYLVSEVSYLS